MWVREDVLGQVQQEVVMQQVRQGDNAQVRHGEAQQYASSDVLVLAIHLLAAVMKTFSAKEILRQLDHKQYQPIWEMMHKICSVMGDMRFTVCTERHVRVGRGVFKTPRTSMRV